jgi:hypothetical protein
MILNVSSKKAKNKYHSFFLRMGGLHCSGSARFQRKLSLNKFKDSPIFGYGGILKLNRTRLKR